MRSDDTLEPKKILNAVLKNKDSLEEADSTPLELLAYVYDNIKNNNKLTRRIKKSLKKRVLSELRNCLLLNSYLKEIAGQFKKESIDFILLKGFVLEEKIYFPFQRFFRDLDLLIRKKDISDAKKVMNKLDYTTGQGLFPENYYKKYKQHLVFSKNEKPNLKVEIHTCLAEPYAPFKINSEMFFHDSKCRKIAGVKTRVLCNEHILLHLCLHFTYVHAYADQTKSAYEISTFIKRNKIDWIKLIRDCKKIGATSFVYQALLFSKKDFEFDIPRKVLSALKKDSHKRTVAILELFNPKNNKMPGFISYSVKKWLFKILLSPGYEKKAKVCGDLFCSYKFKKM